jgi:hypothetical protein
LNQRIDRIGAILAKSRPAQRGELTLRRDLEQGFTKS